MRWWDISYPIGSHHQKPSNNIGFVWVLRCSSGCIQAHWLDIFQVGSVNAAWHCLQSKSEFNHPLQWLEHVWTHLARTTMFVLRKHPTYCRVNRGNPPKIIQNLHQNLRRQGEGRWLRDVQRKRFRGWSGGGGSHCHLVAIWVHHLVGRFLWGLKICFFLLLLLIWRRPHPLVYFYHTHSHSVFSFLGTLDNLGDHILCSMVCCISMQLFGHPMLIPSGYD